MHRRALLTGLAVASGGLAGCLQSADGEPDDLPDSENSDDEPEPSLGDSSIETTGTDCSSGETEEITVEPGDDQVAVRGTIQASTPCHDAVLEAITLDDRTLELTVDVAERDGTCVECVGEVDYEVTVEVDHVGGGSHGASWESDSAAAPAPTDEEAEG